MMNPNETAFPSQIFFDEHLIDCTKGLTKREFFAALALTGILAAANEGSVTVDAEVAVMAADALIQALKAQPSTLSTNDEGQPNE